MANDEFSRLFTVSEANALIPRLELIVRELQKQAQVVRVHVAQLMEGQSEPPDLEALSRRDPAVGTAIRAIAENAQAIEEMGCFLKDIDLGLVDFPAEIAGEVVFLCWQYGEPQLLAWHALDAGFATRQPLAGSRKPMLN
ncbi:MAG TPA: DUF2203 domain-containing protein [Candidatus Binataceae bacterium]|nr:DUF2203 domain-containing protein [Candidatus Binataceae bacterium]